MKGSPVSQRPYLWPQQLSISVLKPCSSTGFLRSAYFTTWLSTRAPSLHQHFGIRCHLPLVVKHIYHGLKASLCTHLQLPSWTEDLPWVLMGLHLSVQKDFVFQHSPPLPWKLFHRPQPGLPSTTLMHQNLSSSVILFLPFLSLHQTSFMSKWTPTGMLSRHCIAPSMSSRSLSKL